MKSFNDFWNSISEDDFAEIADKVNGAVESARNETTDMSNLLGNQISVASILLTKEILKHYHEWLTEQL